MILNDFTLGLSEFVLGDMRSALKFMMQNNAPQLMNMINRIIERIKVILSAKLAALNAFNKSTKRQSVKHTTIHHNKINSTKKESNSTDHKKIDINVNNNSPTGNPIYVANNKKAVNKVIYCVLALLLGGIGAHKFYAGKVAAGILYLLFFWTCIPAIIAFIEFILALILSSFILLT